MIRSPPPPRRILRRPGRDLPGSGELGGGLRRRPELPERQAELVVDFLEIDARHPLCLRHLQGPTRRGHRFGGPIQRELAACEVLEVPGARLFTRRDLQRGQCFRRPPGVEQRQAQLVVDQRVLGGELQLLPELRDGLLQAVGAGGGFRQEHHAQVVVRAAHARVLGEGARSSVVARVVLASVAVGAADEDAGLGDGPSGHYPRVETLRRLDLLQPQVLGGDEERLLGVVGRGRASLVEPLDRGLEPSGRGERFGEHAEGLRILRGLSRDLGEDYHGQTGLPHLEVFEGQRAECLQALDSEERSVAKRLLRLRPPPIDSFERRFQEPTLEKRPAIQGLGAGQIAVLQVALGGRDGLREGGRGVRSRLGEDVRSDGARQEEAGQGAGKGPRALRADTRTSF